MPRSLAALTIAAALLTGCGGGAGGANAGAAAPVAPVSANAGGASSGSPILVPLTVVLPAAFHHASLSQRKSGPAYVNPGSSNTLKVWVDGNAVLTQALNA